MSDKQTEALKLALEAIEACLSAGTEAEDQDASDKLCDAYTAIREALAEQAAQQQKPVALGFIHRTMGGVVHDVYHHKARQLPEGFKSELYTSPPASKPWVGLTDEEIALFINGRGDEDDDDYVEPTGDGFGLTDEDLVRLARRAEAKLREKNA